MRRNGERDAWLRLQEFRDAIQDGEPATLLAEIEGVAAFTTLLDIEADIQRLSQRVATLGAGIAEFKRSMADAMRGAVQKVSKDTQTLIENQMRDISDLVTRSLCELTEKVQRKAIDWTPDRAASNIRFTDREGKSWVIWGSNGAMDALMDRIESTGVEVKRP